MKQPVNKIETHMINHRFGNVALVNPMTFGKYLSIAAKLNL